MKCGCFSTEGKRAPANIYICSTIAPIQLATLTISWCLSLAIGNCQCNIMSGLW